MPPRGFDFEVTAEVLAWPATEPPSNCYRQVAPNTGVLTSAASHRHWRDSVKLVANVLALFPGEELELAHGMLKRGTHKGIGGAT
jgi:hypothetical protein